MMRPAGDATAFLEGLAELDQRPGGERGWIDDGWIAHEARRVLGWNAQRSRRIHHYEIRDMRWFKHQAYCRDCDWQGPRRKHWNEALSDGSDHMSRS